MGLDPDRHRDTDLPGGNPVRLTKEAVITAARIIAWGKPGMNIKIVPTTRTMERAKFLLEVAIPLMDQQDERILAQAFWNTLMDLGYQTEEKTPTLKIAELGLVDFCGFVREEILKRTIASPSGDGMRSTASSTGT